MIGANRSLPIRHPACLAGPPRFSKATGPERPSPKSSSATTCRTDQVFTREVLRPIPRAPPVRSMGFLGLEENVVVGRRDTNQKPNPDSQTGDVTVHTLSWNLTGGFWKATSLQQGPSDHSMQLSSCHSMPPWHSLVLADLAALVKAMKFICPALAGNAPSWTYRMEPTWRSQRLGFRSFEAHAVKDARKGKGAGHFPVYKEVGPANMQTYKHSSKKA